MKNIICKIFGHSTQKWKYYGGDYMKIEMTTVDGVGRQHARIDKECTRCGETFYVGSVHVPYTQKIRRNKVKFKKRR